MTFLSASFFTVFGRDNLLMTVLSESSFMSCGNEDDMSTITPIATEWSSFWYIFFTTPGDDPVASFTCLECELDFVDEHI
jgi:hypothetical protein